MLTLVLAAIAEREERERREGAGRRQKDGQGDEFGEGVAHQAAVHSAQVR
jgi:hypothetical protein